MIAKAAESQKNLYGKNNWKAVKKVLPNKTVTPQPSSSIDPITVDGKTTTDALTIANGFCIHFTNVEEKLLSSIPPLNRKLIVNCKL